MQMGLTGRAEDLPNFELMPARHDVRRADETGCGLLLNSLFEVEQGMAIAMWGEIGPCSLEILIPKLFDGSKLLGFVGTGSGHIDLDTGKVGDEIILLPLPDDIGNIRVCELGAVKIVFPRILNHIREDNQNLVTFLLMENRIGDVQRVQNLCSRGPFLAGQQPVNRFLEIAFALSQILFESKPVNPYGFLRDLDIHRRLEVDIRVTGDGPNDNSISLPKAFIDFFKRLAIHGAPGTVGAARHVNKDDHDSRTFAVLAELPKGVRLPVPRVP
jgi:hypothetical protein